MTKIVFATGNRGKLREASEILGDGFELVTPADFGITEDIPETGETLQENSLQKARYIYDRKGCDCFADDTGLEVDALGGAPGVYTARYVGPSKDFNLNMDKVLAELATLEATGREVSRRARFRSVVTIILDGEAHQFEGTMEGTIAREKSGGEASATTRSSYLMNIPGSRRRTSPRSRRTRSRTEARLCGRWHSGLTGGKNKLPEKMQVVARCAKRLNS